MSQLDANEILSKLRFDGQGLVPAVVQDVSSGRVLTLAYMNRNALELSIQHEETYFWSRSREKLWHKGETSGNTQKIVRIDVDCDGDALLISVQPRGPACHTGQESCFHEEVCKTTPSQPNPYVGSAAKSELSPVVERLMEVIKSRKQQMPEGSYTTYLFTKGLDKILKKIGEESAETIIAAKNKSKVELTSESADLLYHLLVLFVNEGLDVEEVWTELERRGQRKKALPPG